MASRSKQLEYHEGLEAARRFTENMQRVLRVSKVELEKREAADKKSRRKTRPR